MDKIIGVVSVVIISGLVCGVMPGNSQQEEIPEEDLYYYNASDRRDPFIPLVGQLGELKDAGPSYQQEMMHLIETITINAILWDEQNPVVMINGEIYRRGDTIVGMTVKNITSNDIEFEYHGLTHQISLIDRENYK